MNPLFKCAITVQALFWSFTASSETFNLFSSGYSDPSADIGIVEITNKESFPIKCEIKAIGIAKSDGGRGPFTGKVTSLPITKTLKPNRAAEFEFDFSTALEKMRRRWSDSTAVLVELGAAQNSDIIDPDCIRTEGALDGSHFEVTVAGLSCNDTPEPCFEESCRKVTFRKKQVVVVEKEVIGFESLPWFYERNHGCYVRASEKYMKALPELTSENDLVRLGRYRIIADFLSCNTTPKPCYEESSCLVTKLYEGTKVRASAIVNRAERDDEFRPWFYNELNECYFRASSVYLEKL